MNVYVPGHVTVVVPAFNAERYLGECLRSVAEQTFRSWDLVVVNDGSKDETEAVARTFAAFFPDRVTVISTDNQGACRARNNALRCATGEYIAFLDSDDLWLPTKLEKQVLILQENSELVGVTTAFARFIDGSPFIYNVGTFSWTQEAINNWILQIGQAPALDSTLLVRRAVIEEVGGFDAALGSYAEDLDLACRLFEYGPIVEHKEVLVGIRAWPGQIHRQHSSMDESLLKVISVHSRTPSHLKRSESHLRIRRGLRSLNMGDGKGAAGSLLPMLILHPIWTLTYIARLMNQRRLHKLRTHSSTFFGSI